ncbi:hypothetical protein [Niallia taxi]|uniref:hypothetical protein n=1 Tax=Niallia taxi TaxID=2499688 RepID=UPI002E1E716B|nr:hypothetical protein [Niallia taxi]
MLNMLCTAVRLGYMSINKVPSAFQADVKRGLGIKDVVEEQPAETVVEIPAEQPVEESPVEPTPDVEPNEEPAVTE